MEIFDFHRGPLPLLISIPHAGTHVPDAIGERFTAAARRLPDTDWCVHHLYEFAHAFGASVIKANYSRYVVDLNRAPDSARSMSRTVRRQSVRPKPSPASPFTGGAEPDETEIEGRIDQYWRPYHRRSPQNWLGSGRITAWRSCGMRIQSPAKFLSCSQACFPSSISARVIMRPVRGRSAMHCSTRHHRRQVRRRPERPLPRRLHHQPLRPPERTGLRRATRTRAAGIHG